MKVTIELSTDEIKKLQELCGFLVRDNEEAEDAIRCVLEKAYKKHRVNVDDANDFREAIIGITNYMAFATKEVVAFSEPIEVDWGLKGTANHKGTRMVIPTVALVDRTEF